jgi:hypothetical protein
MVNGQTKLIVTVKEARKLLGKKYSHLSDEHIEFMIVQLHGIAKGSVAIGSINAKFSGT